MSDAVKLPRISSVSNVHPWYETAGWTVHTWETKSHEESVELADKLQQGGWLIWIVGNNGNPGLTVYLVDQEYWREKYGHDRPWNCSRPEFGVIVEVCRDDGEISLAEAAQSPIYGFWGWKLGCGRVATEREFKMWRPVVEEA
jgi:hypothetical protein